jgi:hypothetical protein
MRTWGSSYLLHEEGPELLFHMLHVVSYLRGVSYICLVGVIGNRSKKAWLRKNKIHFMVPMIASDLVPISEMLCTST